MGAGAVLAGDISLGDNAVVGANAVVLKDVPADCLAVGVPATVRPRKAVDKDERLEDFAS